MVAGLLTVLSSPGLCTLTMPPDFSVRREIAYNKACGLFGYLFPVQEGRVRIVGRYLFLQLSDEIRKALSLSGRLSRRADQ